ncbi:MAG: preprotein translocase subunit SecG [Patescibacteria group bacterium]
MIKAITILQIIFAIILTTLILIQNKEGGLSGVFGGAQSGNVYRTKRGMEKTIAILTIIFAIIFLGISFVNIWLQA